MAALDVTKAPFLAKGDNLTDNTAAIQAAVNAAGIGDTVLVPAAAGYFMVNPLVGINLKSNMTLQIAAGAVVKAITTDSLHYCMFNIADCENVSVVGPGMVMGDADTHPAPQTVTSQWGFGFQVVRAKNVSFSGLGISKCYGDGIGINDFSQNVTVDHVKFDSNYRCGISPCKVRLRAATPRQWAIRTGSSTMVPPLVLVSRGTRPRRCRWPCASMAATAHSAPETHS